MWIGKEINLKPNCSTSIHYDTKAEKNVKRGPEDGAELEVILCEYTDFSLGLQTLLLCLVIQKEQERRKLQITHEKHNINKQGTK